MSNTNIINFDSFNDVGTSTLNLAVTEVEVGKRYEIITVGNTDFILMGSDDNLQGTVFEATDIGIGTGVVALRGVGSDTDEVGVVLSDNFNTWRKKTNGIVEKINIIDSDVDTLTTNAALLNATDIQNFASAVGGEFKDYGTMSSSGNNTTINLKDANIFKFRLESSETLDLTFLSASEGCSYTLIIENTGNYQIIWPSQFKFANGAGNLTKSGTSANPVYDICKFTSDGTNLYAELSAYIDVADDARMQGAATTHFINAYASRINTANAGPQSYNTEYVRTAMRNLVRAGHYIMARFEQKYTYGTGNGTGTGYRQLFVVYYVISIASDGRPNLDFASGSFI